jgi:hypothetical protein
MWLTTYDESGWPHVIKLDEAHRHAYVLCRCNPRVVKGVVFHRVLNRAALYTPLKGGGH